MKETRRKKKEKEKKQKRKTTENKKLEATLSKQLLGRNQALRAPLRFVTAENIVELFRKQLPWTWRNVVVNSEFGCESYEGDDESIEFYANLRKTALRYDVPRDFDLLTIDTDYNDYWTKANLVGFCIEKFSCIIKLMLNFTYKLQQMEGFGVHC